MEIMVMEINTEINSGMERDVEIVKAMNEAMIETNSKLNFSKEFK